MGTPSENYQAYLSVLNGDFTKIAKLEFLNPDGTVAFALDNNPNNSRADTFTKSGTLSVNRNNGKRRQLNVVLDNVDEQFTFDISHVWFGQQIDYYAGVILPDGTEYYLPQGRFEIENPQDALAPNGKTASWSLIDKWANLDGTHFGNLEDVYSVLVDTNIFDAIAALLHEDKYGNNNLFLMSQAVKGYISTDGLSVHSQTKRQMLSDYIPVTPGATYTYNAFPANPVVGEVDWTGWAFYTAEDMSTLVGSRNAEYSYSVVFTAPPTAAYVRIGSKYLDDGGTATLHQNPFAPIDEMPPLFTNYYNDKTQTLTDGTTVSLIQAPHDYMSNSTGTMADVVLGLVEMIAGEVGYNQVGRLFVNPSQDDISDADKPVLWDFSENKKSLLKVNYSPKITEVYNDIIVVGATNDLNETARGRAQNVNPKSSTCISRIGRKTLRLEMPNYYSDQICQDYAEWMLKRYTMLSAEVQVTCTQMFHIVENELITIQREDKPGAPIERHLVTGFSCPVEQTGAMTINCVSVNDITDLAETS